MPRDHFILPEIGWGRRSIKPDYLGIRELGLTQVQAAARLGLKQPDVSKLVNGRRTDFSADRLIALLNRLEVDVDIVLRPRLKSAGRQGIIRVREAVG